MIQINYSIITTITLNFTLTVEKKTKTKENEIEEQIKQTLLKKNYTNNYL